MGSLGTPCADASTSSSMTDSADNVYDGDNDGAANAASTNLTMQLLMLFLTNGSSASTDLRDRLDTRMAAPANAVTTAGGMASMTDNAWVDSGSYACVCKVTDGVLVALPLETGDTFSFNIQYTMTGYSD